MNELLLPLLGFGAVVGAAIGCAVVSANHFWHRRPVHGVAWLASGFLIYLVELAYFVTHGGAR